MPVNFNAYPSGSTLADALTAATAPFSGPSSSSKSKGGRMSSTFSEDEAGCVTDSESVVSGDLDYSSVTSSTAGGGGGGPDDGGGFTDGGWSSPQSSCYSVNLGMGTSLITFTFTFTVYVPGIVPKMAIL